MAGADRFGVTMFHPLGLLLTLAMGIYLLWAHRSRAVLPLAIVACLIPAAQRIVFAGLDWNMLRILVLFGWARVLIRGDQRGFRPNSVDIVFAVWIVLGSVFYATREATLAALVNRLGAAFDGLGVYFLFRLVLRRPSDIYRSLQTLVGITVLLAGAMIIETATGRNLFAFLGGVKEFSIVRDGSVRAQGAFSHPLMAAGFGATLLPSFLTLRKISRGWSRSAANVGIGAAIVISLLPASGGALAVLAVSLAVWFLWRYRYRLSFFRWGVVAILIVLYLIREKPVWHLLVRISNLTGGEGFHRYRLIEAFFQRWDEWFFWGLTSTTHWGWAQAGDITNQYILEGLQGGVWTLAAFIALLTLSFRAAGRTARSRRVPIRVRLLAWGLGVSLFAHAIFFLNVSYFGQMRALLFMTFAMNASLYSAAFARRSTALAPAEPDPPPNEVPEPADPQEAFSQRHA